MALLNGNFENVSAWEDFKREALKTEDPITFNTLNYIGYTETAIGPITFDSNFDIMKEKFVIQVGEKLSISGEESIGVYKLTNLHPKKRRLDLTNIIACICCTEIWFKAKRNAS